MSYTEKSLQCVDCGATFAFTVEEQEFFASKGYTNEPKRCLSCRQARKPFPRPVIKVQEHNLLPCSEGEPPINDGNLQ